MGREDECLPVTRSLKTAPRARMSGANADKTVELWWDRVSSPNKRSGLIVDSSRVDLGLAGEAHPAVVDKQDRVPCAPASNQACVQVTATEVVGSSPREY